MLLGFPLADAPLRTRFEWGRIQTLSEWMSAPAAWTLMVAAAVAMLLLAVLLYRRDTRELRPVVAVLLMALRGAALLGLFLLFLQPQWRTEREVVHPSRAVVLVDTSMSMGLADVAPADSRSGTATRAQQLAAALDRYGLVRQLRSTHEVVVVRFDEGLTPITSLARVPSSAATGTSDDLAAEPQAQGGHEAGAEKSANSPGGADSSLARDDIDWQAHLRPVGRETRLGQALQQVLTEQRNAPLAGIVLLTDGAQNAGPPAESALELAREAKVPIFPVGVGSPDRPVNVRVYELEAPERAHPGDPYSVTGLIQAHGLSGQAITAELYVGSLGPGGKEELAGTQQVVLGRDGEVVPVKFQLTPTETGRRRLSLRLRVPRSDHNPDDNRRDTEIDIVDRKLRVLLFAGGPMRDYQFLRTLLYRDPSTLVDVYLQSAEGNISQEADQILDYFPDTREALFAYDCIVAFDPQWHSPPEARAPGLTPAQIDLLETWVAEQGGGLILVAGPVNAGQALGGWIQDPAMAKVRALYPVDFLRSFTVLERNTYVSKDPWPLEFTREGREAEFLWLADTEAENEQAWASFPGVYACQPVRGPKAAASVYAYYSDPRASPTGQRPVYFAGQFYGSGRVFYMGSGELWRLRRQDEGYFDRLYTRLIRHVSQGRLLRQSSRGTLLVDKDRYLLGATAEIRAQLTSAQMQPLVAPSVALEVFQPNGKVQSVRLRADSSRPGLFVGQLTLLQEGDYRLELLIPESDNERLTRRLQVRLPDLERENPQRNDPLLSRLAESSGGRYYRDLETALAPETSNNIAAQLRDCTRTSILTEARNEAWERYWRQVMMFALCGVLCLEWLIRRLVRLA